MAATTPRQNALRCRRMLANPCVDLRRAEFDLVRADCVRHSFGLLRCKLPPVRRGTRQLQRLVLDQENVRRTWMQLRQAADELYLPWFQWRWNLNLLALEVICFTLLESKAGP